MEKSVKLDKTTIKFGVNRINEIIVNNYSSLEKTDAREIIKLASEVIKDTIHCNLFDIRKMAFISNEALDIFFNYQQSNLMAIAVILDPKHHDNLENYFNSHPPPKTTTRLYYTEKDARNWLYEVLKNA